MRRQEYYDQIDKQMAHEAAVKRERDLLEAIAPAIAFLEQRLQQTTEAIDGLKKARATALAEITRLEESRA